MDLFRLVPYTSEPSIHYELLSKSVQKKKNYVIEHIIYTRLHLPNLKNISKGRVRP
jgi:hypothetical protein